MKRVRFAVVVASIVALVAGVIVKADLIGVAGKVASAQTSTSFAGSISYTAGGAFTLNSTPDNGSTSFSSTFGPDGVVRPHVPGNNAASINILVPNANGSGASGNGTDLDFKMYGQVDTDGSAPYDGVQSEENRSTPGMPLLGGSLLQFGFDNQQQRVDFRFALDATSSPQWAGRYLRPDPGYAGGAYQVHDIGVVGTFTSGTTPAWNLFPAGQEFGQSFTGDAQNQVVPIACASSIGDFVWNDLNGNGRQDPGEPGLDGVKVILNGTTAFMNVPVRLEIVSAPTGPGGASGFYQFTNLCLGNYTISVDLATAPAGFKNSPPHNAGTTPLDDSDAHTGTLVTINTVNYANGVQTVDFGFVPPSPDCTGVIGDFVWLDANRDGLQDGEMLNGIGGIRVRLTRPDFTISEFVTGGSGAYQFTALCAGHYSVQVVDLPPGLVPTSFHVGGDSTKDSDAPFQGLDLADNASSDLTIDFGLTSTCAAQIGDFVWLDTNGDGVQDFGEPGIAGWTVQLNGPGGPMSTVTDANGYYMFGSLCAGSYTVNVLSQVGFDPTMYHVGAANADSDANGLPVAVTLANDTSTDFTIDFGFTTLCSGKIGNYVFLDTNENGIQDGADFPLPGTGAPAHMMLTRLADNALLQNVVQDSNGYYQFVGVCPGQYRIDVTDPIGYGASPTSPPAFGTPSTDSNPNPTFVTFAADGQSDQTIDFGYISLGGVNVPVVNLSVSKTDNTTTYIQGGVLTYTVTVSNFGPSDANSVLVRDSRPSQLASWSWACTSTTGGATLNTCSPGSAVNFADFLSLPANSSITYTVTAAVGANASGTLQNSVNIRAMGGVFNLGTYCISNLNGDGIQRTFDIPSGRACTAIDTDLPSPPSGSIGDFIWNDLNNNGVQDPGETGTAFANTPVTLLDSTGAVTLKTTNADGSGFYHFTALAAGSYIVRVAVPGGFNPSPTSPPASGTPSTDSNGTAVGAPSGFVQAAVTLATSASSDQTIDFGFSAPPGGACTSGGSGGSTSIKSSFNGTSISTSRYVWFNSNFRAEHMPKTGGTIYFTNASVHIVAPAGTVDYPVPDAVITFSATATCARTSFSGGRWVTTVPVQGSDEIFLSGLGIKAPFDLKKATVTWSGRFSSDVKVKVTWKWGAAVYTTDMTQYASLGVKAVHGGATDCNFPNAGKDHAGTPENRKASLVAGARGGGGSNYTGSWSGDDKEDIKCPTAQSASGGSLLSATSTAVSVSESTVTSTATALDSAVPEGANLCPAPGTSPAALLFSYESANCTGAGCGSTPSASASISGDPAQRDAVYVVATTTGSSTPLFSGPVSLDSSVTPAGAYFAVMASVARLARLGSSLTLKIYASQGGALLSTITLDTSCKQPLFEGDRFGSLRLGDNPLWSGMPVVSGSAVSQTIVNDSPAAVTINEMKISWPSANGALRQVILDGVTIWNGSIKGVTATISNATTPSFKGAAIAPGAVSQLQFVFQNPAGQLPTVYSWKVTADGQWVVVYPSN